VWRIPALHAMTFLSIFIMVNADERQRHCHSNFLRSPGLPDFYWYNIPKLGKIYQITMKYTKWPQNIPNGRTIDQMALKYRNICHCKSLHNLPKLGFLVWKYTIWQPWRSLST
jgi:hypothetical protein